MTNLEYLDCELSLTGADSAALKFEGQDYSGRPVIDEDLEERLRLVNDDPKRYGSLLFEALLRGEGDLLSGYRNARALAKAGQKRLRFRLRIEGIAPAFLHSFSWEMLYDPADKEALSRSSSAAFSRYLGVPIPQGEAVEGKPRMLVVLSHPSDLPYYNLPEIDPGRTRRSIEKVLGPLTKDVDWEILEPPVTAGRLHERLHERSFHLLHIQAHGHRPRKTGVAHLVLEDRARHTAFIDPEQLSDILAQQGLRLVTLMACHSGSQSDTDPFQGLAASLVRQGIPAVVAMRRAITLEAAAQFTKHFYSDLVRAGEVDSAANEARMQLYLDDSKSIEWSIPTLFMRLADGCLWEPETTRSESGSDWQEDGRQEDGRQEEARQEDARQENEASLSGFLGQHRILRKIGEGGMGTVYVALDTRTQRKVALKTLPPEVTADPDRLKRFQREVTTLASLNHPNIITLFEFNEDRGVHYFTMEWVKGNTLGERIPRRGLGSAEFFRLAEPLLEAVDAAHRREIIHRDLKPQNVMVSHEGRLKVLDFGLAKLSRPFGIVNDADSVTPTALLDDGSSGSLTATGRCVGTPRYMSPEQVRGVSEIGPRSDIFSLGVIFYQMLTGALPFHGATIQELLRAILDATPSYRDAEGQEIRGPLRPLLERCLEKDPKQRFKNTGELKSALDRAKSQVFSEKVVTEQTVPITDAHPDTTPPWDSTPPRDRAPPWNDSPPRDAAPSRPGRWPVVAAAVLVLIAVMGWWGAPCSGTFLRWRLWNLPGLEDAPLVTDGDVDLVIQDIQDRTDANVPRWYLPALDEFLAFELQAVQNPELTIPSMNAPRVLLYTTVRSHSDGEIHLDFRLEASQTEKVVDFPAFCGRPEQLIDHIVRLGPEISRLVGREPIHPPDLADLPLPEETAEIYGQGLRALRLFDFAAARGHLRQTVDQADRYVGARLALAEALWQLGKDEEARKQLQAAAASSRQGLSRETRLLVSTLASELGREYERAAAVESALWYRDRLVGEAEGFERGLRVANLQIKAGWPEARNVLSELTDLSLTQLERARLDLLETRILTLEESVPPIREVITVSKTHEADFLRIHAQLELGEVLTHLDRLEEAETVILEAQSSCRANDFDHCTANAFRLLGEVFFCVTNGMKPVTNTSGLRLSMPEQEISTTRR